MRLQDKVSIITGAGHGIGRAYARRFADEGARVVIAEIDAAAGHQAAAEINGAGKSAWARATDVTRFESVQRLVADVVSRFGRIDVLLNNAALYVTQPVTKCNLEELSPGGVGPGDGGESEGGFSLLQGGYPGDEKAAGRQNYQRRVRNVFHGSGNMPHYTTSKGGVVAMTRVLARQLGAWNINVNCLTPGSTMSEEEITEQVRKRRAESSRQRAFQRIEVPEDITGTALFLASADSDFMTGQLLVVDGGGVLH